MSCAYWPPEKPEADVCLSCGCEGWGCVCDPTSPLHGPRESAIERARRSRLTMAEIETLGISPLDLNGGIWW